jgi:predicted peptidase
MNLVAATLLLLELTAVKPETVEQFADKTISYTGGEYENEVFHYRLLAPEKIEPGVKYPLVLFLHGAGERGSDNVKQLMYLPELMATSEYRTKFPCFLIAPQCRDGKQWVEVPWGELESRPMKEPSHQMNVVMAILEAVQKEQPVDGRRIYLTGLSMGGYGAWDLAMRHPEKFAAVAPVCGGGDEASAKRLVGLPIWAFHGSADNAVPPERSRNMIAAIKKAGGSPKYTELEGVGHNSWTPAYAGPSGLIPWMFQQVRSGD